MIGDALPQAREQVDHAAALYVRERFGAHPLDEGERRELSAAWDRVRVEWWRALALRTYQRISAPPSRFFRGVYRAIERWGKG